MSIAVYSIESGRDVHLGHTGGLQTLVSLIDLARHRGATGVSLHGKLGPLDYSGEVEINAAIREIVDVSLNDLNYSGPQVVGDTRPPCAVCCKPIDGTPQFTKVSPSSNGGTGVIVHHPGCSILDIPTY